MWQVGKSKKQQQEEIEITLIYSFQRVFHLSYETRGGREADPM